MSGYREMVLIPLDEYKQFQKQLLYQQAPELSRDLMQLGEQTEDLPVDQRIRLEGEVLNRHIRQQDASAPPPPPPSPVKINDQVITNHLQGFPKVNKIRANQIYQHLKAYNEQWNDMGQLVDNDSEPIPRSNIVELIDYVTNTKRKARQPAGFDEFVDLLQRSNTPRHLLSTTGVTRVDDYKQLAQDDDELLEQSMSAYKRLVK